MNHELRKELLDKLDGIGRLDLWRKPECKAYFREVEEPSVDDCIINLLSLFPEKKIYVRNIKDDPFAD